MTENFFESVISERIDILSHNVATLLISISANVDKIREILLQQDKEKEFSFRGKYREMV